MVNGEITTLGGPSLLADLHFPFYQADGETFVGFAVSNFSEEVGQICNSQAFEPDGSPLEGLNPAAFQLGADGQLAKLGNEIFELPGTASQFGWVLLGYGQPRSRELLSVRWCGKIGRLGSSAPILEANPISLGFSRAPPLFGVRLRLPFFTIANPNLEEVEIELTLDPEFEWLTVSRLSTDSPRIPLAQDDPGQGLSIRNGGLAFW